MIGEVYYNNDGARMTVIEYKNSKAVKVKFDSGYEKTAYARDIRSGKVKDPYYPTIYNVGFIGKGYGIEDKKRYSTWRDMLKRCYDPKYHEKYPTYRNCEVCKEWHNFQNFAKWYNENYYEIDGEHMCLDKDILVKGNKIYSPDNCIFVPIKINNLFVKKDRFRSEHGIGVRKHLDCYSVSMGMNGKTFRIGSLKSKSEAFAEYKKIKEEYIKSVADEYKHKIPVKLYEAMCRYEVLESD